MGEYGENTAIADESEISSNFEKSQTDGMDLTEMSSSEKQMTNETDEDLLLSKIQKMDLNQLENRASPNRTTVKRTRSQKDRSKIVKRRIDRENEKLCQFDADSEASETENDVYKCEIKKVKKTLLKKNTSRFRRK